MVASDSRSQVSHSLTWTDVRHSLDFSSFPGEVLHSRFYRRPEDYEGEIVLVVGSFASGSDVSRQLASLNLKSSESKIDPLRSPPTPPDDDLRPLQTRVYQSSSPGPSSYSMPPGPGDPTQQWREYITPVPLISHISPSSREHPRGLIHFQDGSEVDDVDVIIFATGYSFSLPFCRSSDRPWTTQSLLERAIEDHDERINDEPEYGVKGLAMKELDGLMLFLDGDRTISFPALRKSYETSYHPPYQRGLGSRLAADQIPEYQIVPFPLAETQSRLAALLWGGLLPSFPPNPAMPPNPSNPYHTPPDTPPSLDESATSSGLEHNPAQGKPKQPVRKVVQQRKKLVFGSPYQWAYEEYLMSLMLEADGENTPDHWRHIEGWRKARRADTTLRRKILGY